jgi:PPP family 3-phenylpropionic acid transporter
VTSSASPAGLSAPSPHGQTALAVVITGGIGYGLYFGAFGAWSPYFPVYFSGLGADLAVIGVLSAIPALVQIVAAPAWGLLADRIGDVRPLLLAAALVAGASGVLLAGNPSVAWLFPGVTVFALGTAGMPAMIDAHVVVRLGAARDRFGQARVFGSIGFVTISMLTGWLVSGSGARTLFLVFVPLMVLTGVAAMTLFGRPAVRERVGGIGPMGAMRLLSDRSLALYFIGACVTWTAASGGLTYFSLRLVEQGADAGLIGIGWAVNAIVEVPVMLLFRRLTGRFGVRALMVGGAVAFGLRSAGWALAGSAVASVLASSMGGIGVALFLVGTTAWVADRTPRAMRATAQALFVGTTYAVGAIVGALMAGFIASVAGLATMFAVSGLTGLSGAAITWLAVGRPVPWSRAERDARA